VKSSGGKDQSEIQTEGRPLSIVDRGLTLAAAAPAAPMPGGAPTNAEVAAAPTNSEAAATPPLTEPADKPTRVGPCTQDQGGPAREPWRVRK
jgi:hypothetical protein